LGRKGKWEYFRVIYGRYSKANRKAKREMLNEFCLTTGYHRKYAIRILNGPAPGKRPNRPVRKRGLSYGHELLSVLTSVWEAAGYPWSLRLKALLPAWMPWIRKRFKLSAAIEKQLLSISPRQMDRRLAAKKNQQRRRIYGRTKPGYLLKHHIPVKTDSWDVKSPGFTEVDLVSHSGNSGEGEFGYSLNITDIQTTWTETRALLGKGQTAVQQALDEIEGMLPFRLLGLDSDNGSEFINWHLKAWCERKQIQLTRGRPYKKDDNAHIEQKNWTHVRKLLGWERYDTRNAIDAMNDLYRRELRLWLNLYLPSVKLLKKVHVGSKLRRVYDGPKTPFERVVASKQGDAAATHHSERTAKISRSVSVSKSHRQETRTDLPPGEPPAESESAGAARVQPGTKWPAKRLWKRRSLRELGNPFGIPTFPQPQQQQAFYGYISNGSTGSARVTFLEWLDGHSDPESMQWHLTPR
jgi:hypothetical protein